jgi:hypothetical protein
VSIAASAAFAAPTLRPFDATYAVEWKGINAGRSHLRLERTGDDSWLYRSGNTARGIFRLAFPDEITQTSRFVVVDDTVRPLEYRADDGSKNTSRDVTLEFDWQARRVTGVAENEPVDVPLESGTQDSMSVQIALMHALADGRDPTRFRLIDRNRIKDYEYTHEGTARIDTALGPLDTVIYRSQRPGSNRVTRMWHAPSLGYVPVRAERVRDGRVEWRMSIRKLDVD